MPASLIPIRLSSRREAVWLALALVLSACEGPLTGSPDAKPISPGANSLEPARSARRDFRGFRAFDPVT
jgi:hypothetical protein